MMEDKQCKEMEQFLAMTKEGDYFLSLHDKSKQIHKVKIDNIQGCDPYQIKNEEILGDINKFPPVTSNYVLFLLSPLAWLRKN